MAMTADGDVGKHLSSNSQFGTLTYHHIATGNRYLVVDDAFRSNLDVMTTDDAIGAMRQEWRCYKFGSCIQVGTERAMVLCIYSLYPEEIVKTNQFRHAATRIDYYTSTPPILLMIIAMDKS